MARFSEEIMKAREQAKEKNKPTTKMTEEQELLRKMKLDQKHRERLQTARR